MMNVIYVHVHTRKHIHARIPRESRRGKMVGDANFCMHGRSSILTRHSKNPLLHAEGRPLAPTLQVTPAQTTNANTHVFSTTKNSATNAIVLVHHRPCADLQQCQSPTLQTNPRRTRPNRSPKQIRLSDEFFPSLRSSLLRHYPSLSLPSFLLPALARALSRSLFLLSLFLSLSLSLSLSFSPSFSVFLSLSPFPSILHLSVIRRSKHVIKHRIHCRVARQTSLVVVCILISQYPSIICSLKSLYVYF